MKKALMLWILSLFFMSTFAGDGLSGDGKDTCKPISCTTSFKDYMGNERSFTRFWLYDSIGRLVLDSINAPDTMWASPLYTEHYRYNNDSTIGTGRYTGTMAIKTTGGDLPLICLLPGGAKYRALYNMKGELEKVIIGRTGINEKGKQDVAYSSIDSIIYFQGNIISYQFFGLVSTKVYCTYIKDTLYKQDFNPTDRLLALIGRPDEVPGFLNTQVFSKEMLNTEESGYTKSYSYQWDERGMVTGIDRTYINGIEGSKPKVVHYSFKYACM
jgi:hypothetical protein